MLEISTNKIARVILSARERGHEAELRNYISDMNGDEQASLVAVMWIGRETFEAEELAEAILTAKQEAASPTESYLTGVPLLADYLEAGLEALGHSVEEIEAAFL